MLRSVLCLVLLFAPALATAGPWPREAGRTFLSFSSERDRSGNRYSSLYGEYGLTSRVTLGVDIGQSGQGDLTALVWTQRPLDDGEGPNRFGLQAGAGLVQRDQQTLPLVQAALSWGRGFEDWLGGGWMTAQILVRLTARPEDAASSPIPLAGGFEMAERTAKSEMTLGLRPRKGLMVINSLLLEDRTDAAFSVRLASSLVFDVSAPLKLEVGLVQPLHGEAERSVKLAGWIEF